MLDNKEFIGKTIQTLRKKAKIKQSELAEKIGISEKHLSKIETGKNFPSLNNFLKMAEILNFNLENFGINETYENNKYKKRLLELIYSANEYEIKSYYEIMTTLNKIIQKH